MPDRRSQAFRRYPTLGYFAGAACLALLLPSGLTLPNTGPPALAEYAPVPGQGQSQQGDLGRLGSTDSTGVGYGDGTGEGRPRPSPDTIVIQDGGTGGRGTRLGGTKRCVDSPTGPQQTEDPLSPPCISYFKGDNGGATAHGVTAEEVNVALEVDYNSTQDKKGKRTVDCAQPLSSDDTPDDQACKAFMLFFNDRYQTYGRRVHLYASHGIKLADVNEQRPLYAWVTPGGTATSDAPKAGVVGVGFSGSLRATLAKYAPYLVTFWPDFEDSARMAASYVCLKLKDRPVSFTDDPLLQGKTRKFAYWGDNPLTQYDHAVLDALKKTCGLEITEFANGVSDQAVGARLKADGVTTVLIRMGNTSHAVATQYATAAGWFPEWVMPGDWFRRAINTNFYGRLADQNQWAHAVGITFDYRRDTLHEQYWYKAYREGCPQCPEPSPTNASLQPTTYDALTLLFWGIQAAGPRLTAANMDKGLHAIPPNGSPEPKKPAAYFSPGNHTFVKDSVAIWWDPSGTPPGSSTRGCYRLVREGKRYRANEWAAGDADVQMPGPCQGDATTGG